jgi:hypothetical protein
MQTSFDRKTLILLPLFLIRYPPYTFAPWLSFHKSLIIDEVDIIFRSTIFESYFKIYQLLIVAI